MRVAHFARETNDFEVIDASLQQAIGRLARELQTRTGWEPPDVTAVWMDEEAFVDYRGEDWYQSLHLPVQPTGYPSHGPTR